MAEKFPYIRFFPSDWLAEETLRGRSLAAHGLWMNMLCLMHKSFRRGYLLNKAGTALTDAQLASAVGASVKEVTRLIQELEQAETFSRDSQGVIYCRRMVKQEEVDAVHRECGGQGGRPPKNQNRTKPKPPNNQTTAYESASASVPDLPLTEKEDAAAPGTPQRELHRIALLAEHCKDNPQNLLDAIWGIFGKGSALTLAMGRIKNLDKMVGDFGVDEVVDFCGPRLTLGGAKWGDIRVEFWAFKNAKPKADSVTRVKAEPGKYAMKKTQCDD